ALAAAILASLLGAFLLERFSINQEAFEGWVLLLAAFFVATMVFWMQQGIRNVAAARKAEAAGKIVVQDACMMVSHRALVARPRS
ncbi:MAG: CoA-binding protein, partial [Candidatus Thermoplasmatota archaeon]